MADETIDALGFGRMRIIQNAAGYRFSIDPLLLSAFARVEEGEAVIDLGTGTGVIPLLLAERSPACRIVGVERQGSLAGLARRNVHLNGMVGRVEILEKDIRHIGAGGEAFDVVLTNPPYREAGSGRKSSIAERAAARHELAGGLIDFVSAAARLLRSGGRFYIVYLAERLAELLSVMRQKQLEPKRLRCIHSRIGDDARMVLVEGRRNGGQGLRIESPLYIYDGEDYAAEIEAIYRAEGGVI